MLLVAPLDGVPKGQSSGLGGMTDGKTDLFGLVPNRVGGGAKRVTDMARSVIDVG